MMHEHDPADHANLLAQLEPLPLAGTAWPASTKALVWLVLGAIGLLLVQTATKSVDTPVNPIASGSLLACYAGLVVLGYFMTVSTTRVTAQGIEQSWLTRRAVAWSDIKYAKFIPLIASKRLICFTGKGRPVVFQAGTRELQIAFAHIALAYRRRR